MYALENTTFNTWDHKQTYTSITDLEDAPFELTTDTVSLTPS